MELNKRRLYHVWKKVRMVSPWYFIATAAISGTVGVIALRANNLEMARLRDAVYQADKKGSHITEALQKLQVYVSAHMNTSLSAGPNAPYPPIQLQYTYDRAVQEAGNAASAANAHVYTDAQHYCEQTIPNGFSGSYRISCVQTYIDQHGVRLPTIPDGMYKFDFLSPVWSPDVAGWSVLITVLLLLIAVFLFVIRWWLKRTTK
jgi:hypothetical protein